MKIILTGGGSGGHFYPLIAVAQEITRIAEAEKLLPPKMYYVGPEPYDERALFENNIEFRRSAAGKIRRYRSWKNIFGWFLTFWGIVKALLQLFSIFPDVIFSKGGYASFPTLVAARLLGIPVIIHESDASVGRVNMWSAKFAKHIAISYPHTAQEFPQEKVAFTGNPIRSDIKTPQSSGAFEYLHLEKDLPTLFILGGSQGAEAINDTVLDTLDDLLNSYQIIHQTGTKNIKEIASIAEVILEKNPHKSRYHAFGTLNTLAMRMAAGASSLVISRAGSGSIFEIAAWGLPSILVPIPDEVSHDQSKNAFAYSQTGAAIVLEQNNLTPSLLTAEINRLMQDPELRNRMSKAAKEFAKPDAAEIIARQLLKIIVAHQN